MEGGTVHSVRTLAAAVDLSTRKIHALIKGERPTVGAETAARMAWAVDVHLDALFVLNPFFVLNSFAYANEDVEEGHDDPGTAVDAGTARVTHELE
ncbi:hypothetical protein [Embleya sp. AB8]|uniref:hypothetical protein n=1 Tax=Embleya sp. AB8 TaxID=3156304 RepID=UPI003C75DC66